MLKILAGLPFIAIVWAVIYPFRLLNLQSETFWFWGLIAIFVVCALIQIFFTFAELENEFEEESDNQGGVAELFHLVRFSFHRLFRQYIHSSFVPVYVGVPFITQIGCTISRFIKRSTFQEIDD